MLWLEAIREHVGTNVEIDKEDFENVPFVQWGGLGKAYKLFGEKLQPMLAELNEVLVA
jgi:type I restriction enzyme, R subunit